MVHGERSATSRDATAGRVSTGDDGRRPWGNVELGGGTKGCWSHRHVAKIEPLEALRTEEVACYSAAVTRCAALLVLVAACKSTPPAPPLEERASPTAVRCPHTEVNFTVAGERLCASVPLLLGHGVGDDGRIDIGTDLLFDRGPSKTPRRYLDEYPDDRPFGVTVSPQFKTADGHQYTLFFGIGGLRRHEWTAPLTRPVLRGSLAYANMGSPENAGAYIQLSRQKLDEHGVPTTSGTYFSKSGTVTFQAIDLTRGRYTGRVDLVFERTGTLAPEDGPDVVEVKGDFDLRGE